MTTDMDLISRQRQIWTNLYGPARADSLIKEATERRAAFPAVSMAEMLRAIDPEAEETYEDFVATRW
ncbi:MAG: hypothetical protein ACKV2O_14340 [Acidimicrobiales bacterium]